MEENNMEQNNTQSNDVWKNSAWQDVPEQNAVGQNDYRYGNVMPVNPKLKKSKKSGIVITVAVVLVTAAVAIAAVFAYKKLAQSPEVKLAKGFANMTTELEAGKNPVLKELDYSKVMEKLYTEPMSIDASFNMTMPAEYDEMGTIGMDIRADYEVPEKKLDSSAKLSVYNVELVKLDMTVIQNRLFIGLPEMLENNYFLNMDALGKDYNASVWKDMLGMEVEEDFSYDMFANYETPVAGDAYDKDLQQLTEAWKAVAGNAVIKNSDNVFEVERDGKTVSCKGISVTIPADAFNEGIRATKMYFMNGEFKEGFIQGFQGYMAGAGADAESAYNELLDQVFGIRVKDDIVLCIYMDKQDKIVRIETDDAITFSDVVDSMQFTFDFTGAKRTIDEVEGTVKIKTENNEIKTTISSNTVLTDDETKNEWDVTFENADSEKISFDYTCEWQLADKEFSMKASYNDMYEEDITLEMNGSFSDIVSGESFKLELGKLNLTMEGEEYFKLNGTYAMAPFKGEITEPAGAVDLLGMGEMEIYGVVEELYAYIMKISGMLE